MKLHHVFWTHFVCDIFVKTDTSSYSNYNRITLICVLRVHAQCTHKDLIFIYSREQLCCVKEHVSSRVLSYITRIIQCYILYIDYNNFPIDIILLVLLVIFVFFMNKLVETSKHPSSSLASLGWITLSMSLRFA